MITVTVDTIQTILTEAIEYEAKLNTQVRTAERNGNGKLVREVLPNKWSLKFNLKYSTPEEHAEVFAFLESLTLIDFEVNFPTPAGDYRDGTFYISPISSNMINLSRGSAGWWDSIPVTFVEV